MSANRVFTTILNILGSSRFALVLILAVIVLTLAGVMLPQEGLFETTDIDLWQHAHPAVTNLLKPLGLFHVFHSWIFLIILSLLGINTLICTLLRFIKEGGLEVFKGPDYVRKLGFYFLHMSILILLAGGFISSAKRLSAYQLLTEGQGFYEQHDAYIKIVEGPLRKKEHKNFFMVLENLHVEYQKQRPVEIASSVGFYDKNEKKTAAVIKFNEPFTFQGVSFTQDDTGYSPFIKIYDKQNQRLLLQSFIALKTFKTEKGVKYHDFLPLQFLKNRVELTLYPSHKKENGNIIKTGEELQDPAILIEEIDDAGTIVTSKHITEGEKVAIGEHIIEFGEIRRWSSFKVTEDPGYLTVCVAIWLGLAALILRYAPDIFSWFREDNETTETDSIE